MTMTLLAWNAALVLVLMTAVWLASVRLRDVSIVDPWWSVCFLLITTHTVLRTGLTVANTCLLALVAVWALRLWFHLLVRSRGQPEDPRYAAFRRRFGPARYWWVSFFQVFLLQGCLALVISAPLQVAAANVADTSSRFGARDAVGVLLFAVGFAWEAAADEQLRRFRRAFKGQGKVLDSGLWGWCRHPNYFGEALLWWGFWVLSLGAPLGWMTLPAPALMTYLLVKVSGVSMLDAHLLATRPAYAEYMRRTPAFLPKRPRRGVGVTE